MNLNLKGKRALVCGASKGLGFAAAKELAMLGAEIILLARTESLLQENLSHINDLNDLNNSYIVADLSDIENTTQQIEQLLVKGPIHILINNTGGPSAGSIVDASGNQFREAFNIHLIASHSLSGLLIEGMRQDNYGRIINIVSTSVRQPISGLGVSNTIRGSIASWAKTLSAELAATGITVNNILPGTTKTERLDNLIKSKADNLSLTHEQATTNFLNEIPMGRFAEPEEIASVIAFIASPAASYLTGTSIPVDGGKIKSI